MVDEASARTQIILLARDALDARGALADLAEGFEQLEHTSRIIALDGDDAGALLNAAIDAGPIACFCGFDAVGADMTANRKLLYDLIEVPLVSVFTGPCWSHGELFDRANSHFIAAFADHAHEPDMVFSGPWARPFVKGNARPFCRAPRVAPAPSRERPVDAVLLAHRPDPRPFEAKLAGANPLFCELIETTVSACIAEPHVPVWVTFRKVLRAESLDVYRLQRSRVLELLAGLEPYVHSRRLDTLLERLGTTSLQVAGAPWPSLSAASAGVRFDFVDKPLDELVRHAKVVVNVLPHYVGGWGPNAEMLRAMAAGAACVTDANAWLAEQVAGADPVVLSRDDGADLEARVHALLGQPEALSDLAERGQRWALAGFPAREAAAALLRLVHGHALLKQFRDPGLHR